MTNSRERSHGSERARDASPGLGGRIEAGRFAFLTQREMLLGFIYMSSEVRRYLGANSAGYRARFRVRTKIAFHSPQQSWPWKSALGAASTTLGRNVDALEACLVSAADVYSPRFLGLGGFPSRVVVGLSPEPQGSVCRQCGCVKWELLKAAKAPPSGARQYAFPLC